MTIKQEWWFGWSLVFVIAVFAVTLYWGVNGWN